MVDDRALEVSHQLGIEIVPTLIRMAEGQEVERQIGWHKGDWESLTGVSGLGEGLPDWGAGCGAKNVEPAHLEQLKIRFGETGIQSRLVEIGAAEDEMEAMFERGWSDGLPLVPPTQERVLRMLDGTREAPDTVLGLCPPNLVPLTVEKVAVNAVMRLQTRVHAGCSGSNAGRVSGRVRPSRRSRHNYVRKSCFCRQWSNSSAYWHELEGQRLGTGQSRQCIDWPAVQLITRNVGGAEPQGGPCLFGQPGKFTYCFAEDEEAHAGHPCPKSEDLIRKSRR